MFTVPGDGDVDFSALFRNLSQIDYRGWVIIEAEQDPAIADPRTYAQIGLSALRAQAASSGLKEAA
jgi:inosose dehydratase